MLSMCVCTCSHALWATACTQALADAPACRLGSLSAHLLVSMRLFAVSRSLKARAISLHAGGGREGSNLVAPGMAETTMGAHFNQALDVGLDLKIPLVRMVV